MRANQPRSERIVSAMPSTCAVSAAGGGATNVSRCCFATDEHDDRHQDAFFAMIGTFASKLAYQAVPWRRTTMDGIIYLVGLIVIILAILSFFGLRFALCVSGGRAPKGCSPARLEFAFEICRRTPGMSVARG